VFSNTFFFLLRLYSSVESTDQKKTACYDIDVEVDGTFTYYLHFNIVPSNIYYLCVYRYSKSTDEQLSSIDS